MGAVVLHLEKRLNKDTVSAPLEAVAGIIRGGNKDHLWEFFKAVGDMPSTTHDKEWLSAIVNWAPQGGVTQKEDAKWLKLRIRVDDLDDAKEGQFTLSAAQDELLWSRLKDPAFMAPRGVLYARFLSDYLTASGRHFDEVTNDMDWGEKDPDA